MQKTSEREETKLRVFKAFQDIFIVIIFVLFLYKELHQKKKKKY